MWYQRDVVKKSAPQKPGSPSALIDGRITELTPVPGSDGMVAPDGFGLDSTTGNMYATDIYGHSIWRFTPGGPAQLWLSVYPELPDGVKVFNNAVYVSIEDGKILRIPINPDGSAGAPQVWAQVNDPGSSSTT